MKRRVLFIFFTLIFALQVFSIPAKQRFPKPEFSTNYVMPVTQEPAARSMILEYLDVFVLLASMSLITWLLLQKRSRRGVFWLTIFSLLYFGFYRKGCVCAIGSIQNITFCLFNPEYRLPISVIAFFIIPLAFTLFFGRTFCAGVCPLGAIQDIFVLRPIKMKLWLRSSLGLIPFIYLGFAVLYSATGTDFVICRYDPFVGIFRLNASFMMLSAGGILLLTGVFIARPYCRFFCPYGVILNLISKVSGKHVTITPAKCTKCKLCENSCPFDAIQKPTLSSQQSDANIQHSAFSIQHLFLILLISLFIIAGGWTGSMFHENMAKLNPKVRLATGLMNLGNGQSTDLSLELQAFTSSGNSNEKLYKEAAVIVRQFYIGGWILGGFIGLVIGLTIADLFFIKKRTDYTIDKGTCLSCGRCMEYCPVKK